MDLSSKIGGQLRQIRNDKDLSMSELGELIFGPNTSGRISNIENGKRGLTIQTLEKILETLNYDLVLVPKDKVEEVEKILNNDTK
nr:helix-turn-helix transcriptional regulator [uncultured Flavobacterium sp.]